MTSKSKPSGTDIAASQNAAVRSLVSGFTDFGFRLFGEVSRQDSSQNVFLSPPSIAMVLTALYTGAAGETRQELANALGLKDMSLGEIQQASGWLRESLSNPDPNVELSVANSLWTRFGLEFKTEFLDQTRKLFGAEIQALHFDDPQAPEVINRWAASNTQGKISRIVDGLDPQGTMLLLNAIYFKGRWQEKFHRVLTRERLFYLAGGGQKSVPMMPQGGEYSYCRGEGFQAAVLPFGKHRIGFYVFLPDKSLGVAGFLKNLNHKNWDQWISRFRFLPGDIQLPRFRMEYKRELNATLRALGLETIFDRHRADFERIRTERDLFVNGVAQKAVVEVNEEGAEAAAVSAVAVMAAIEEPEERFTLILDRPFFFAIRDEETGTILFLGVVNEPN